MLIVKDASNRLIYIEVGGKYDDDITITSAYYPDTDCEVDDDTIEFILENFYESIYQEWHENRIMCESFYAEALNE